MARRSRQRSTAHANPASPIFPHSITGKAVLAACGGVLALAATGAGAMAANLNGLISAFMAITVFVVVAGAVCLAIGFALHRILRPIYTLESTLQRYRDRGLPENLVEDGQDDEDSALIRMIDVLLSNVRAELRQSRNAADTDPLTGLLNRRGFDRHRHPGDTGSIIFVDLDHFKQVNDHLGHDAGDLVLSAMAELLKSVLRENELVARFGGEEFVVFLPQTGLEDASQVAERIRSSAEDKLATTLGRVTISAGVAQKGVDESFADALARADRAVYVAKRAGRNCVRVSDDVAPEVGELTLAAFAAAE